MNPRALTLLLALLIFAQISPAAAKETREQEIERDFRELRRFDDFSAEFTKVLALIQRLTRLDPFRAPRYFEEGLRKIGPDPRDIKAAREAASAEIYAARVSAIGSLASGIGKTMSGSLKSNQAAFSAQQKDAEQDVAGARASIDAEADFLKKMNQEIVEITKRLQAEIAQTPHPVVRAVD